MLVGMASKRALLELLSRDELLAAVDLCGVDVPDRRAKNGIVDALVASRKVSLAQALADFPRDRLKDLCRSLGLDDAGREKTALIDRLTGASAAAAAPGGSARAATAASDGNGGAAAQPRANGKQAAAAPPTGKLTREQLEGYLWAAGWW
jgi:DNA polymerase III epsilon subunit-like protein